MKIINFIRYEFENALLVGGAVLGACIDIIEFSFRLAVQFLTAPLVSLFLVYLVLLLIALFL